MRIFDLLSALVQSTVFHYVFGRKRQNLFLDSCLSLLAHGGQLLLGDLPNASKRARFFASPAGIEFQEKYAQMMPNTPNQTVEKNSLDDSIIFALLRRAHIRGFDAYLLPQAHDLPMANRREDILIVRP